MARRTSSEAYHHLYNTKRWKELRLETFLRDQYICQHTGIACIGRANTWNAPVCNHIVRHEGNEELFFDPDNLETTTKQFHDSAIQSMEKGGRLLRNDGWGATSVKYGVAHPEWLKPSAIPLTIVCGPPASGKSTYCKENALRGDIIIDLDDIRFKLIGVRHAENCTIVPQLLWHRNEQLSSLQNAKMGNAYFIVSAPTQAERNWWQGKLGGRIHLIDPGIKECKRRAIDRGQWNVDLVDKWYRTTVFNKQSGAS